MKDSGEGEIKMLTRVVVLLW